MKKCNWCKSDVDNDAIICPNCGKGIWDKKQKKGILMVGICFLAALFLLFIVVIVLALISPSVEDKCKNAKFITLEEIYELRKTDSLKAEELYKGKYFKFNGTISHRYKNYIQIQSDYVSSDTYFSAKYKDKAYNYNINDKIVYCGKINFGMAIQVKNTMIVDDSN